MFDVAGQSVAESESPATADHLIMESNASMLKVATHSRHLCIRHRSAPQHFIMVSQDHEGCGCLAKLARNRTGERSFLPPEPLHDPRRKVRLQPILMPRPPQHDRLSGRLE